MEMVVASDGSVYVIDPNNYAKNIRKLSNPGGSDWVVSTVNTGLSGSCNANDVTYPKGLGIGLADELYTYDYTCRTIKIAGLPPALPVQAFPTVISCPGVAHHLAAGAGPVTDRVSGGGWSLTPVKAGPTAPTTYYGDSMVQTASLLASNIDPYNSAHRAWVFRASNGMRLGLGSGTTIGGPAGLTVAVWFRLDDNSFRGKKQNVVFQLTLANPAGGTVTVSMFTTYWDAVFVAAVRVKKCCTPSTTSDSSADYAASTSSDMFTPAPNNLQFAGGKWQHMVAVLDAAGGPSEFYWNGIAQDQPAPSGAFLLELPCARQR